MEEQKTLKITNKIQFNCMVKFMEKNTDITRGVCRSIDRESFTRKWHQLTNELNVLGPPCRDYKGWEKVWRDYKLKIKKKIIHNSKERLANENYKTFSISPLEESVVVLLNLDKTINQPNTNNSSQFEITEVENISSNIFTDEEVHIKEELIDCENSTVHNNYFNDVYNVTDNEEIPFENEENFKGQIYSNLYEPARIKKNKINDERQTLLRKQTENMNKIVENTNEIARCLKNIQKAKSEKFILYKRELESKMKYREEKKLWRNELLAYKKQKLAIQQQQIRPD